MGYHSLITISSTETDSFRFKPVVRVHTWPLPSFQFDIPPYRDFFSGEAVAQLTKFSRTKMLHAVFSLTLARSPMASRSYRRASDFLNYSPGLASDILAERKRGKFFFTRFF